MLAPTMASTRLDLQTEIGKADNWSSTVERRHLALMRSSFE
jgi:hypothetical protein